MNQEELSKLSDEALLKVAEDNKPSPVLDAFLIGFLIGIIIFGVVVSAWGITLIIPLYLIYVFLKKPKRYKAIQDALKERNLQ